MNYLFIACLLSVFNSCPAENEKLGKVLSFFNVVQFPNTVCEGSGTRNGTCYTAEECEDRDGTSSGSCAEGFGVCCVFQLSCGQRSAENCTFLVQTQATDLPTTCDYTICPSSSDICRMRFQLTTFEISAPVTATGVGTVSHGDTMSGGSLGDCAVDTFSITSSSGSGTPVICGTNSGQHMFVDSNGQDCVQANFAFGSGAISRQFDIKVEQFACGNDMGGPPGCLQYFTALQGTVTSFNFNNPAGGYEATTAHLSNQNYNVCFRRRNGQCAICFAESAVDTFGLSVTQIAGQKSEINTACITDYLTIPQGNTLAITVAAIAGEVIAASAINYRFCGYNLNTIGNEITDSVTVCTRAFTFGFFTNDGENDGAIADTDNRLDKQNVNEVSGDSAIAFAQSTYGTSGFSLNFKQEMCT